MLREYYQVANLSTQKLLLQKVSEQQRFSPFVGTQKANVKLSGQLKLFFYKIYQHFYILKKQKLKFRG